MIECDVRTKLVNLMSRGRVLDPRKYETIVVVVDRKRYEASVKYYVRLFRL